MVAPTETLADRSRATRLAPAAARPAWALPLLLALPACANVTLSPAAIDRLDPALVAEEVQRERIATWREAVALANDFLASSWRRTLPAGRFELDDERGMTFVTEQGSWPIAVRCTTWGDLCVMTGFAAQEREDGFVVGGTGEERHRLVDNSLFVTGSGWVKPADDVASLILHETTHTVWREGTVGFWNGVAYYLEAVFLLRAAKHSAERRPHATSHEFGWFWVERDQPEVAAHEAFREWVDEHLADEETHCDHGPFEEAPPPPGARR